MESDVKTKVKEYYGAIANKINQSEEKSCYETSSSRKPAANLSTSNCCDTISNTAKIYIGENLGDLPKAAVSASLGCANPVVFAQLKEGETVLDLGSGGGINVLMSAKHVGLTGKVYGLDMTDEMLALANKNKEQMGVKNVEFIKGFIENIPLEDKSIDVIISNCVINLSDDKTKALSEAYRVLKNGGRVAIADIISLKPVSSDIKEKSGLWCGCIGGTLSLKEYQDVLAQVGFNNIEIEPVHIYTRSVIEGLIKEKNFLDDSIKEIDLNIVDGTFAGAYIKGTK